MMTTGEEATTPRRVRRTPTQASYYRIRMQHTLRHTREITRLIYLVNGAIGGAIYFILKDRSHWTNYAEICAFLLFVLAAVNLMHGYLIHVQGKWYGELDTGYAKSVGLPDRPRISVLIGAHNTYALLHYSLAGFLIMAAFGILKFG